MYGKQLLYSIVDALVKEYGFQEVKAAIVSHDDLDVRLEYIRERELELSGSSRKLRLIKAAHELDMPLIEAKAFVEFHFNL